MKFINRDHRHITRRIFPKESTCRFRNIAKIAKKKKKEEEENKKREASMESERNPGEERGIPGTGILREMVG